jgi:hypothetical protein
MDRFGDVAEEGLVAKSYRIVFLKKTPSGYAFASPYYPSLPASPMACGPDWDLGQDAYHKVLQRVLDVLCTRSGTDEKRVAVGLINWQCDSSAAPFLKAALTLPEVRSDPVVRTSIVGDLLKWRELTVLPLAEADLFQPSQHTDGYLKSNLLLAISSLDPRRFLFHCLREH